MSIDFKAIALFLFLAHSASSIAAQNYVPGEIIVRYKSDVNTSVIMSALKGKRHAIHKSTAGTSRTGTVAKITIPKGASLLDEIKKYKENPNVEHAQPNYIYRSLGTPNDIDFYRHWGLHNSGQTYKTGVNPGTTGSDISMVDAWDIQTDCSSSVVAVLDTGINYNSLDLNPNMWDGSSCSFSVDLNNDSIDDISINNGCTHGYDFVDDDKDPMDFNGHGTHVAGTIGASGNNGVGGTGVCWNSKLMAVRVLDTVGIGTTYSVMLGIMFAADNGAQVINASIGYYSLDGKDEIVESAVDYAIAKNVTIVAAAGNDQVDVENYPIFPCAFSKTKSGVICVAAVDSSHNLASFSNYGSSSINIGAPGVDIYSTYHGTDSLVVNDKFEASDWVLESGWGSASFGSCWVGAPSLLVYPSDFCSSGQYSNNVSSTATRNYGDAFKTFDSAYGETTFATYNSTSDYMSFATSNTAVVDFTSATKYDGNQTVKEEFDLFSCAGSDNCSAGYKFESNSSGVNDGSFVYSLKLYGTTLSNNSYIFLDGTSMAAPHVAGVVALLKSLNPSYTTDDVRNTVIGGGVDVASMSGKSTSGKTLNALGTLKFIAPPSGVAATQTK